jgi:dihydroorotase (multifunctional complex type)
VIVDSVLNNAKVYLKGEIVDCSIAIEEGKIQKIGKETQMPNADTKINVEYRLVLPGVVDSHVHLRDEEKAYKETFTTGTAAAAAGGVTTVLDMPNNTPLTNSVEALKNRMELASRRVLVDVGFYSSFPSKVQEIGSIAVAGTVGFKLFMAERMGGLDSDDDDALTEAFGEVAQAGVPVAVHAEDHALVKATVDKQKQMGKEDLASLLKAHSDTVELKAVKRAIKIAEKIAKLHLHICHVSTKKALDAIKEAKKTNANLTCEATPHHLLLTLDDYALLGNWALTMPPLRTKDDVKALWQGIAEATVDTVGSDHAPHTREEKDAVNVWDIKPGVPGLETTLPLMLTLVHKRRVTLGRAIELLSEKPATIFRLADRGRLEQGLKADFVVVDFNAKYKIDASKFKSKAKLSPFDKMDVQGKPVKTFVSGQLVMDEGEIVARAGCGGIVRGRSP